MAKGGSTGPQTTTNQTIIDPSLKAAWSGNVDMANILTSGMVPYRNGGGSPANVVGNASGYWDPGTGEWHSGGYNPSPGSLNGLPYDPNGGDNQILNPDGTPFVAPTTFTPNFNADQLKYQSGIRGLAGLTPAQLGGDTFTALSNFSAPTVTAPTASAARVGSVNPMTAASIAPVADMTGTTVDQAAIASKMNPYISSVIDPTKAFLAESAARARNAADMARGTGSFGGSRHGVADALLEGEIAMQGGQVLSGLYGDAFKTAASLADSEAQRGLVAGQANLNKNLQTALTSAQLQQDASARNFDFAGRQALTNAGFDQQTGLANMDALLRTGLANQDAGIRSAGVRAAGASGLANATLGSRNVDLQNLGLLGDVGNQIFAHDQERIMDPFKALNIRMGAMGGMPMQTGSTSTTTGGPATGVSPLLGGLGGAIGGAGLAQMLALSNPWTAGLAALGGLAGLMST